MLLRALLMTSLLSSMALGCWRLKYDCPPRQMKSNIEALFDRQPEILPKVVSLAYQSCIDGCHGYLSKDPMNDGLRETEEMLNDLHQRYGSEVSRADFWAFAAVVAMEKVVRDFSNDLSDESLDRCPEIKFDLYWGRKDLLETDRIEPRSEQGDEMFEFVKQTFGLNFDEANALMGVHNLAGVGVAGNAGSSVNSGYFLDILNSTRARIENCEQFLRHVKSAYQKVLAKQVDGNALEVFDCQ